MKLRQHFSATAGPCVSTTLILRLVTLITIVACFSIVLSAQSGPATTGQWSSLFSMNYEPIHVMVLPNGKVLFWALQGASLNPQIWDPATNTVTPTPLPGYQVFCAGHSFLGDDKILVSGGNLGDFVGVPNASLYDPIANTWTRVSDMNAARWYPTNTTLSNGDVLVTSGEINTSAGVNTLPQVWQAATRTWRDLTSAQLALPLYPRMFLAPNGKVLYATPDSTSRYLDTSGTGAWTPVANLNFNYRDYDTAVMYDVGKILAVGGGDPPTATAEVIDLNAASPSWRYVGSMATPRRQLNGTILADGRVLITGGSSGAGFDNASAPVFLTEMWDPVTENFTPMASITQYRGYHSTAVLLPDGRVLSAGGDVSGATAEIFSPPYLFNGARPTISSTPTTVSYGQTFSVTTPDAANIAAVNLIRLSSVTHSFNQDQRINHLSFTIGSGSLNVTTPASGNLAPPGPYMLFILNGNGVPSVAQIIQLTTNLPPTAVASASPMSGPVPLTVSFSGTGSTDPDGTVVGYSWDFGDGQTSTLPNPNHTYTSAGTYTVTLTVTDNAGATASQSLLITATVVHPPAPVVASVNPGAGTQGGTLSVAINGSNFQSGAACGFGSGINVNSCVFNSTSQLTANLTISSNAPLGPHDVTVVNPDLQSNTLLGGFLVNPPPSVTSLTPNSGGQGQLISVIISGSNFQNGAACSFGAGTTVNSCAFNSTSQLTAQVSIRATASLGSRDVTVTNPDNSSGTLKAGFSVVPSAISLIQRATFSLQPSPSGTVTLALPQPTAAGHTLIVGVSFWPLDLTSVTDTVGDTFKRGLPTAIYHNVSGSPTYNNFYYGNTAGGASSLTLNFSGGSTYLLVAVAEVAGLDSMAPLDQAAYNESLTATTSWSSAAVTTTAPNEYLFSWAATEASKTSCTAPGTGWTIEVQTDDLGGATVCLLDLIASATGTYQASVTAATAQNYAMEIVTFVGGSGSQAPPPSVTSVNPNSGTQGQNLSSVLIAGSNFQSGAQCNFGSGVTVNTCAFNSSTQLTANISISSTAAVGTRDVTVINLDNGAARLTNGFSVTSGGPAPAPAVSSVSPNSGVQGQNLPTVTITGSNFQSGATCSFGAGVTVNSCTFNSSAQLTANISIGSTATVGTRNVTVTNPDTQSGTLTNGFSVASSGPPPAPTVSSVSPNSGNPGQNLPSVTINGSNFQSGATCSFGAGITVNSCSFGSATQLTANISITSTATLGSRNVTVTNPDTQSGTLTGGFTVTAAAAISLIQKATFSQEPSSSGTVTLTLPQATGAGHALIVGVSFYPLDITGVSDGSGDTFTRGLATSVFHNTSQGAMYTNFLYAGNTAGGTTSLTLHFSGGSTYVLISVAEVAGLSTTAPLDQSGYNESLSATATPWSSATVTTTAANEYLFAWAASEWTGTPCSSPTSGWTIESQINDSAGATVCMVDRIVSATGSYQVSVTPGGPQNYAMELATFKAGAVGPPPPPAPNVSSVSPNSGVQGQNLPTVTITGSNFQSGATCSFGAGVTVTSCTFNSSAQLTANISISSTATVGTRNVTVTNPDTQSGTLTNGFSVASSGPAPAPTVSSVSPNSGNPGQNLPSVTITGSNFQSGATCSFGAGITVNSCSFGSATQLTANITITSTATLGSRNVTVTNPDTQSGALTGGFTVTAAAAISLIQKATFSQEPSSSGTVTLTLPQATGAGHALIVGVSFYPLDITGVSDGSGDTFTRGLATSVFHNTSQGAMYTNFFYAGNTAGGTTSLTLHFSGGSTYVLISVAEVAGLSTTAPLDQSGYNESLSATATPWSSATVTTTAANEYLFAWAASEWTGTPCSSPTSGWTIESQINDSAGATVCMVDRIVSATGSYQISVTPGGPQNYAMEIVTFK